VGSGATGAAGDSPRYIQNAVERASEFHVARPVFRSGFQTADAVGRPVDLMDLDDPTPTVRYVLGSGELVRVL